MLTEVLVHIHTQKYSKNMVSAFHAPSTTRRDFQEEAIETKAAAFSPTSVGQDHALKPSLCSHVSGGENDMSETEDEEVKMNCIGGVQVYATSSDEDEFDDDDESCCSDESREDASERDRPAAFGDRRANGSHFGVRSGPTR